uniref:Cathepsin L-like n=1 Tax=Plectus sambesii TaxID=2011161 RepID=A0A914VI13_9BILA
MKVFIVFCLAIGALAADSSQVRHQNLKVVQMEFEEWQLLTPIMETNELVEENNESAQEMNELPEETNESAEDAFKSEDKDQSTDSFKSLYLDGILFRNNERNDLRELIRRGRADWQAYKEVHGKVYNNESEDNERQKAFLMARQTIREHNEAYARGEKDFYLGLNHLSDLLPEEYSLLNGFIQPSDDSLANDNYTTFLPPLNVNIPSSVDWRQKGFVTPVKNQGKCGSCWAFSATGALEGQTKRKTGRLVSLSEQNLVDCSGSYGNKGCKGGWMERAFQYVINNGGINTENAYPYEGIQSQCRFTRQFVGAVANGFVRIQRGNEGLLQYAVATAGPVAVAIDASPKSLHLYKGGIYYEPACSSVKLTHAVLVVGYGSENGKDYWLVKNSWGTTWGDRGYIRMARNQGNNCGIATMASYPQV